MAILPLKDSSHITTANPSLQEVRPVTTPLAHFTKSSIARMEENYLAELRAPVRIPPKLEIESSAHADFALLRAMDEISMTGRDLLLSSARELELITGMIKEYLLAQAQVLQSSSNQLLDSGFFSWIEKIGSYFFSALYITCGTFFLQTGSPVLGTTLIAAGTTALSNLIVQEMKGWDTLADYLAQENEELQKQIVTWAPRAVGTLSHAIGALACSTTAMPSTAQLFSSLGASVHLAKDVGEATKSSVLARLSDINGKISLENSQKEALTTWLKHFVEGLHKEWEQVKTSIELHIQTAKAIQGG